MKKALEFMLSIILDFGLTACTGEGSQTNSSGDTSQQNNSAVQTELSNETSDDILIAYFSKTGNTETIANMIAEQYGGRLFKIKTVTPTRMIMMKRLILPVKNKIQMLVQSYLLM